MKKTLFALLLALALCLGGCAVSDAETTTQPESQPVTEPATQPQPYIGSDSGAALIYDEMDGDDAEYFIESFDVIRLAQDAQGYDFNKNTGFDISFEWVDGNGLLTVGEAVFAKISEFEFAAEVAGELRYVTVSAPGTYDVFGFEAGSRNVIEAVYFGGLLDVSAISYEYGVSAYGNEFEIGTLEEFATGTLKALEYVDNVGDGALRLTDGETDGVYISGVIDVADFEYLVMSWNADTPAGTWVEVKARALVNHMKEGEWTQTWTPYLSWGKWSPYILRASTSNASSLAKVDVDTFTILGSRGETAGLVQVKVILHSDEKGVTPVLRYLHGAMKNTLDGQTIAKDYRSDIDVTDLDKTVEVPQYSQLVRDPRNAGSICSPTSVTMLMNSLDGDLNRIPEEVAQNLIDNNYGFGNWSFGMAAAGSYGFKAYVDYTDITGMKKLIAQGYAVAASVSYSTDKSEAKYLEGAYGSTPGHLVVIRGFKTVDGVEYIVCNDAYAADNVTVYREYKLSQFLKCWTNGVIYVVKEKEEGAGTSPAQRVEASLVEVEEGRFEVRADGFSDIVLNLDGNVVYTTVPEVFQGADTTIYTPVLRLNYMNTNTLPLPKADIDSPDFKLYVVSDVGYIFIVTAGNVTYLN